MLIQVLLNQAKPSPTSSPKLPSSTCLDYFADASVVNGRSVEPCSWTADYACPVSDGGPTDAVKCSSCSNGNAYGVCLMALTATECPANPASYAQAG